MKVMQSGTGDSKKRKGKRCQNYSKRHGMKPERKGMKVSMNRKEKKNHYDLGKNGNTICSFGTRKEIKIQS